MGSSVVEQFSPGEWTLKVQVWSFLDFAAEGKSPLLTGLNRGLSIWLCNQGPGLGVGNQGCFFSHLSTAL